jgi:hypothetical protein
MSSLATEQVLALAMARHPRLGVESPAALLTDDTTRVVLRSVQQAHRAVVESKRIFSVCVRTDGLVDRVEFHYSDGTRLAYGGHGGHWRKPFNLEIGEYLVCVAGRMGAIGLSSITLLTDRCTPEGDVRRGVKNFTGGLNGSSEVSGDSFFAYHAAARRQHGQPAGKEICALACTTMPTGWLRSIEGVTSQESIWSTAMARLLLQHPSKPFAPDPAAPYQHRVGALAAGHDLSIQLCTFAQAHERANNMQGCAGFTFEGVAPTFEGVQEVFFKGRRDGNDDWRWQTYLCTNWAGPAGEYSDWPGNMYEGIHYNQNMFDDGVEEYSDSDENDHDGEAEEEEGEEEEEEGEEEEQEEGEEEEEDNAGADWQWANG